MVAGPLESSDGAITPPGLVPLAEGREDEQVFVRPDGNVVKVMRSVEQEPRVHREAAALQALADRQPWSRRSGR